jgi:hypothetical protein
LEAQLYNELEKQQLKQQQQKDWDQQREAQERDRKLQFQVHTHANVLPCIPLRVHGTCTWTSS